MSTPVSFRSFFSKTRTRRNKRPTSVPRDFERLEERAVPAVYTWTGAQDGNWSNSANWSGSTVPSAVDTSATLVFGPTSGNNVTSMVDDLGYALSVANITFSASGFVLTTGTSPTLFVPALTATPSPQFTLSGTIADTSGSGSNTFDNTINIALGSNATISVGRPAWRDTITGVRGDAISGGVRQHQRRARAP